MAQHATIVGPPFRFSRIFEAESDRQLDDRVLMDLAAVMSAGGASAASQVPAGYTYFGQFVAHDLSFSESRPQLGEFVNQRRLAQGRSPALDLDSLYGDGPAARDAADGAGLYEDQLHLRVGATEPAEGFPTLAGHDLPRRHDSIEAVLPDARNDENLAIAQTHLAFVHFHNRVANLVDGSFQAARETVTKHYQWAIKTDYLPRVCSQAVIDDVFEHGRKIFDAEEVGSGDLTMPVEFAVAAFRFGHSMLRRGYSWNQCFEDGLLSLELLFAFSGGGGDLHGATRLPSSAVADFRRLYELGGVSESKFNRAMRIDTALAGPLREMPARALGDRGPPAGGPDTNLAFRDLRRAKDLGMASGQELAGQLRSHGVAVDDLSAAQILEGAGGVRLDGLDPAARAAIASHTPLWFYILREAEIADGRLAGVGARIVVEVIHRAMQGSTASIVNDPSWQPWLGGAEGRFGMVDLLRVAFDDKGLAPLEAA